MFCKNPIILQQRRELRISVLARVYWQVKRKISPEIIITMEGKKRR